MRETELCVTDGKEDHVLIRAMASCNPFKDEEESRPITTIIYVSHFWRVL